MTKLKFTIHGDQRINQRGFRRNDVELIRRATEKVREWISQEQDAQRKQDEAA